MLDLVYVGLGLIFFAGAAAFARACAKL